MRKQSIALAFVLTIVAIVGSIVLAGVFAWVRMSEPYQGYRGDGQFVEIPRGANSTEIRRRLSDAGVIKDGLVFRAALWWTGKGASLKAGEYHFDRPMSTLAVVDKLARGDVYGHRITFPEGLTIREMAQIYASRGFGPADTFVKAAADPAVIEDLDPGADDLEGYLFPETYAIPRNTPAATLVGIMVARFREVLTPALVQRAREKGLSVRQVVTLASLVEKETARGEERPVVAAVYLNRLKRGMAMQADPTVVYALEKAGRYDGNIRRADLDHDSPYNTYKYPGLPPGPIAAPGKAAIEAVLAPADVGYLYFVSRNDGTHVFADTLAEHNANVYQYQVLYFRAKNAERRRNAMQ